MHAEVPQRFHGRRNGGKGRYADVFDKDLLRRGGTALHAVEHNCVGSGFDGERNIVIGT